MFNGSPLDKRPLWYSNPVGEKTPVVDEWGNETGESAYESWSTPAKLKYTIATEDCATRQAIADNARAIVDNCNANFRSMMDYFTQDKIATLTAENQNLKFAASQDRQNALLTTVMSQQTDTILNRVNPRPIPAYQVANPNVGVNCCGCC